MCLVQEFITAAMDRKRALTSETLTRVFSELDDDDDGELGPRVFCSALQVDLQHLALGCRHVFAAQALSECGHSLAGICGGKSWP